MVTSGGKIDDTLDRTVAPAAIRSRRRAAGRRLTAPVVARRRRHRAEARRRPTIRSGTCQ
jgi:hypothetical protein